MEEMDACMQAWMDVWSEGSMDGWTVVRTGCIDNGCVDGWREDGRTDKRDRWMDAWVDAWMDGWMDLATYSRHGGGKAAGNWIDRKLIRRWPSHLLDEFS